MKASPADSGSNFFFFYKSIYSDIYQKNTSWRGGEINSQVLRFTADRNSFLKRELKNEYLLFLVYINIRFKISF